MFLCSSIFTARFSRTQFFATPRSGGRQRDHCTQSDSTLRSRPAESNEKNASLSKALPCRETGDQPGSAPAHSGHDERTTLEIRTSSEPGRSFPTAKKPRADFDLLTGTTPAVCNPATCTSGRHACRSGCGNLVDRIPIFPYRKVLSNQPLTRTLDSDRNDQSFLRSRQFTQPKMPELFPLDERLARVGAIANRETQ